MGPPALARHFLSRWRRRSAIALAALAVALLLPYGGASVGANTIQHQCQNSDTDAAALTATINASASGDEIVIGGTCRLTSSITLLGDRSYRGNSRTGTVLRQADGRNLPYLLASDSYVGNLTTAGAPLSIRHLTIDGNSQNNSTGNTDGLVLRSWASVAEDLHVIWVAGSGIRVANLSLNTTSLTTSAVAGRIVGNLIEQSKQHGIFVDDPGNSLSDWEVLSNNVGNSGLDAIHISNAAGYFVAHNHVWDVGRHGIYADRCFGTGISDNFIEDFGKTATAETYGVNCTLQGDVGSVISNNRVFNFNGERASSSYRYVSINQVNYGSGHVSVTGNVVKGPATRSLPHIGLLYFRGGLAGTTLTVASTGNQVADVTTDKMVYLATESAGI